jgi:hypothetical protein
LASLRSSAFLHAVPAVNQKMIAIAPAGGHTIQEKIRITTVVMKLNA